VLVLLVSSAAVVTVETREDPRTDVHVGTAMNRLSANANAALRAAATTALRDAAAAPVTDPANTAVGSAIAPDRLDPNDSAYPDRTFRNYAQLRIYLAARERLAAASGRFSGDVTGRLSLPPVTDDPESVRAALDRVEMRAGTYARGQRTGVVDVTLRNVTATVVEGGRVVAERSRTVSVVVPTTVFELHEQSREYERRLETGFFEPGFDTDRLYYGFGRKFAVRQYPVSWAKSYLDRYAPPAWDRAFPTVHDSRQTEVLANDAVYDVQRATFGTVDSGAERVMRERWLCFGLATASEVIQARNGSSGSNGAAIEQIENGSMLPWTEALNESLRTTLRDQIRVKLTGMSLQDAICAATKILFRDADVGLPDPPGIAELVEGAITARRPASAPENNTGVTVTIDEFADAVYYRATGENVTARLMTDMVDPANQTSPDPPDVYNFSTPNRSVGPGSPFEDRIDEAIGEVYDVRVTVGESASTGPRPRAPRLGGSWRQTDSSYRVTRAGSPSVTARSGPVATLSATTRQDVVTVSTNLTSELTHVRIWERPCTPAERNASGRRCPRSKTTTDTGNVTFAVDVDVDAAHSLGSEVEVRGMTHAYDTGGPGPAPTFKPVRPDAIEAVFDHVGGFTGLESALAGRIDATDVTTAGTLATQLRYETSVRVNASLKASDRAALEGWLATELNETRTALSDRLAPLELGRSEVLTDETALKPLIDRVGTHSRVLVYADVHRSYDNPADKARAELRANYLDGVIQQIAETQSAIDDRTDAVENKLDDDVGPGFSSSGDGLGEALGFAESARNGGATVREGNLTGSPLYEDVEFVVDGSPTYLSVRTVDRSDVPAVRALDGGPTDLNESVKHAPMVSKYDNLVLPHPGLPVVPWPGYWYVTLSTWQLQVDAEYARFEVRAEIDDPVRPGTTSYVRTARPVELSLSNGTALAGRVEPIDFESDTVVVVVVPSYLKHPRGKVGVGDVGEESGTPFWGCGGPFPHEGPQPGPKKCEYLVD